MSDSDNSYVVVARRYRPRGFDELVGQEHVGRALKNAIETNRVGHAYLFTGARGVGKTSTARIFAKALNDPSGPTASPDNTSDIALAIDSGEDVDVIEIDGASNRGIDEIRSLRANVGVRPSRSRFKIYIIDEVHMLTGAAFNALLKTLEEPPEHVKFIFCTTDPEKIPITVLSRCQRFDFAPVEVSKIVQRLHEIVTAENAQADEAALELIARRAAGSMRDSQSLLEQVLSFCDGNLTADQVHSMLGTADDERLHALAKAMANRNAASALEQMDAGIDGGIDAGRLAEQLLGYFRDLMAVTVGCDESLMRHTSASLHGELQQLGKQWGLQTVLAVVGLIDQTLVRIRHSVYARVLLEATVIQICNLPDLQKIADLAAAAGDVPAKPAGEKKNVASPPVRPAPSQNAAPPQNVAPQPEATTTESAPPETTPAQAAQPVPAPHYERVHAEATATPQPVAEPAVSVAPSVGAASAAVSTSASVSELTSTPVSAAVATAVAEAPQFQTDTSEQAEPQTSEVPKRELTHSSVSAVWAAAADMVEVGVGGMARSVDKVELAGTDSIQLLFPAEAKLSLNRFSTPESKSAMSAAIMQLTGRQVTIDCKLAVGKPTQSRPTPKQSSKDRMQRMREIETNPLVKACSELFDAEIVKVDHPR